MHLLFHSNPNPFKRLRSRYPVTLAVSLFLASGLVHAVTVTYCVSTAQGLKNALHKSSDGGVNNGKDNHIHLVQGTYAAAATTPPGTFE